MNAIVTGGGSGIGKATCHALARAGYRVCVADINERMASEVAESCGGFSVPVDLAIENSVETLFREADSRFNGRLDALATPGGTIDTAPFMEVTVASFHRVYAVNVVGTYLCMREAAKRMKEGGRICTVASVAGKHGGGGIGTAAYVASKGAVIALTRNAARELGPRGIAVNGVAPGSVRTPMTARHLDDPSTQKRMLAPVVLGRIAEPEEIAEAIVWLLSPAASYVQGEMVSVDGGVLMD